VQIDPGQCAAAVRGLFCSNTKKGQTMKQQKPPPPVEVPMPADPVSGPIGPEIRTPKNTPANIPAENPPVEDPQEDPFEDGNFPV
jgi:hypothetical protein